MPNAAWICDRWKLNGLQTLFLENEFLKVGFVPEMGGNIYQIVHKPTGSNLLFNHPRVEPRRPNHGEPPENRWCGGIDEVVPTLDQCRHRGEPLSSMGEVFPLSWHQDVLDRGPDQAIVRAFVDTFISTFHVERQLQIVPNSAALRLDHEVRNISDSPFEYLWGLYVSLPAVQRFRIDVPASLATVEEDADEPRVSDFTQYAWPSFEWEGKPVDMRHPLPENWPRRRRHYLTLSDGWFAFTDLESGLGLGYRFPKEVFPYVILDVRWRHRGVSCISLATATAFPSRLDVAAEQDTAPTLGPWESIRCHTQFVLYEGLECVEAIDESGGVHGPRRWADP